MKTDQPIRKRKISRRRALQGMAATTGAAAASLSMPAFIRTASAADPIRVGIISPLTGAWTVYGKAHISGFELAVDEINAAGGVLGRQIELGRRRFQDRAAHRGRAGEPADPPGARRLPRGHVLERRTQRGRTGGQGRQQGPALPAFYEGQEKEYYPGVCNENVVHVPRATQQVWPHMEYMMNKYGKKFFMIGSDYAWPQVTNLVTKRKLAELGGEVVAEVYIPFGTPQYESVLRDIRGSGADIIFHSLTGSDTVNFRQQYAAAGMKDDFTLWTVDDEEVVTTGLGPEVSGGDYVSFDYFMSIEHPNNAPFLERFKQKFGQDALMNTVGVAMYNAAHMAALALEKAGEVSTDALRETSRRSRSTALPRARSACVVSTIRSSCPPT